MPWRITSPEDARLQFMLAVAEERYSFAALCRAFGISRKTGYKWRAEFDLREQQPNWGRNLQVAQRIFISEALIGEPLGLGPLDDGLWAIFFTSMQLGHFDEGALNV